MTRPGLVEPLETYPEKDRDWHAEGNCGLTQDGVCLNRDTPYCDQDCPHRKWHGRQ